MKFVKVRNNPNILKMECEVVEKPFTWVMQNEVMTCSDSMDVGPIDPDAIPLILFENWKEFGVSPDKRSDIIPMNVDLNAHEGANNDLRLYGTINLVESIDRNDFQVGDEGLKGFLQMLLKTIYVRKNASFEHDLMPVAIEELKIWDKESIYHFVANVLGKNVSNVSVADVAHVVHVLTGKDINIDDKGFNILEVAQELTTAVASANKPDEFFSAAFPCEVMEYDIVKSFLVDADDDFYFGRGAKHPKFWGINGPGNVLWRAEIQRSNNVKDVHVEWGPVAGTLYERAIDSKQKLFGTTNNDIPFVTPLASCSVFDTGMYPVTPRNFNTGIRYMASSQKLASYRVTLSPTDLKTIEDDINRYPIARLCSDPSYDDIKNELVRIYNNDLPSIDGLIGEKHFMVFKNFGVLANTPEEVEACSSRESDADKVDAYVMPGKPATVRGMLMYVWTLMHMSSDALCYRAAANDDFTVESAIDYVLDMTLEKKKAHNLFLLSCAYSEPFGGHKKGTREVVNLDRGLEFDDF